MIGQEQIPTFRQEYAIVHRQTRSCVVRNAQRGNLLSSVSTDVTRWALLCLWSISMV